MGASYRAGLVRPPTQSRQVTGIDGRRQARLEPGSRWFGRIDMARARQQHQVARRFGLQASAFTLRRLRPAAIFGAAGHCVALAVPPRLWGGWPAPAHSTPVPMTLEGLHERGDVLRFMLRRQADPQPGPPPRNSGWANRGNEDALAFQGS